MIVTVLAGFAAALAAPWMHRRARGRSGWLIALLPLGLTVYLGTYLTRIAHGATFRAAYTWVPSLGGDFAFKLDGLSLLFALIITGMGTLVVFWELTSISSYLLIGFRHDAAESRQAALHFGETGVIARALATMVFLTLTAPVAAHMLARAGYFVGVKLADATVIDELGGHYDLDTHVLESCDPAQRPRALAENGDLP